MVNKKFKRYLFQDKIHSFQKQQYFSIIYKLLLSISQKLIEIKKKN